MPLGLLDNEAFERELSLSSNNVVVKEISRGRNGALEVPKEIRALAAQEVLSGADPNQVAKELGISTQSVNAYKNDATSLSSYNKPNEDLKKSNDEFRNKIKELASEKLIAAIEAISTEKLSEAKPQVASSIARDMSSVVKNISPEVNEHVTNQVIIYKPRMKDLDEYEVIDVTKV